MSENSGRAGTNAAAKAAALAVSRAAERREEAARAAAASAAKARLAAAAQERRDAARSAGRNPYVYPGHYTQTPPTETKPSTGGGSTSTIPKNKVVDNVVFQPAMPTTPEPVATINPPTVVRTPTRNVTDISSLVPQFDAEQIQKLLFENISAIELSMIERHDTIEGINQKYSTISNLSEMRKKYDADKQLSAMEKFKPLTSIYAINIQDKIPQEDYIILENLNSTYQYLDENDGLVTRERGYSYIDTNGDLVIELINLEKNQQVEIQIDKNGTMYKVES